MRFHFLSQPLPSFLSPLLLQPHHNTFLCRQHVSASQSRPPMGPGKARLTMPIPHHDTATPRRCIAGLPPPPAGGEAVSAQAQEHGSRKSVGLSSTAIVTEVGTVTKTSSSPSSNLLSAPFVLLPSVTLRSPWWPAGSRPYESETRLQR